MCRQESEAFQIVLW